MPLCKYYICTGEYPECANNDIMSNDCNENCKGYEPEGKFDLKFCKKCYQMTNHIKGKCQKCREH
jgi:hypothetical protein